MGLEISKTLKTLSVIIGSVFCFITAIKAQTSEIGLLGGINMYKGEVSPHINVLNSGFYIQGLYRYNIDNQSIMRVNFTQSTYSANDNFSTHPLSNLRRNQINGTITELSGLFEYNFTSYRNPKSNVKSSTYVFIGLGLFQFNSNSTVTEKTANSSLNLGVPLGIGFKYAFTKTLNFNIEFGSRKTFTDFLDNTSNKINNRQNGFKYTKDWYSLLGIGITRTFYPIKCPIK